eukprot:1192123-Prorocentrum_minimum.AAC.2
MRGLLPPTPSGTPPGGARGARLVRSPGEAGQRQRISRPVDVTIHSATATNTRDFLKAGSSRYCQHVAQVGQPVTDPAL